MREGCVLANSLRIKFTMVEEARFPLWHLGGQKQRQQKVGPGFRRPINLKACSQQPTSSSRAPLTEGSTTSQNSAMSWRPSVQPHELVGNISNHMASWVASASLGPGWHHSLSGCHPDDPNSIAALQLFAPTPTMIAYPSFKVPLKSYHLLKAFLTAPGNGVSPSYRSYHPHHSFHWHIQLASAVCLLSVRPWKDKATAGNRREADAAINGTQSQKLQH